MVEGVLLDIDGTLLQSNGAHAQAWSDALLEFGYHVPTRAIEPLIGMAGSKLLARVAPDLDASKGVGKEVTQRRREIVLQVFAPHLIPTPGARALVERIRATGLIATVATSSSGPELDALLRASGVQDLIEHASTKDDAEQSKPAPDIVEVALEKSGIAPAQAVMIGDTPYDVESGNRAGVRVIAVRCGGHSDRDLEGAVAIYDDPADLLAHWDTSPLGEIERVTPI